jgi:F-type H+-transporting ATPase subunit b
MSVLSDIGLVLAATESGGSSGGSEGNFLVTPNVGLMLWTLIAFGVTLFLLRKLAFPRIQEALEKRSRAIAESIDAAERTRSEADQILNEYRERLREAREQADDIVGRARKAADRTQDDARVQAKETREEMLADARRDIEQETRRAIGEIRREVADLTVAATEKVTRKSLDGQDHQRLIDEALQEFDFSALSSGSGTGSGRSGGGSSN